MPASLVLTAIYGSAAAATVALGVVGVAAATFAINFVVSAIVARVFAEGSNANQSIDNGVRQQVAPGTTNSIPIVYGNAYLGGTFVDAVLTVDQKQMYYVLAISSISPNGQFSFDRTKMYYGDRLITFDGTDLTKVVSLTDGAGNVDTKISGNLAISLYTSTNAGIITAVTGTSPSSYMGGSDIAAGQRWTGTRQMNGLAFAIVKLNYNRDADTTQLQPITFRVSHYLNGAGAALPGDVWYDYITNETYGGGMATSIVDSASASALNSYSNGLISFTDSSGNPATQARYRINGVLDTGQNVLSNIDRIMVACDSWNQYNAASGLWSIVINKAETSSFSLSDSNIIGEIKTSLLDISNSINQVEAQFPNKLNRDQRDVVYLETSAGLLYANEPVNKYSVNFDLVNDSVQASYLANRLLEQAREDLIVTITAAYPAIQIDAGDVVSLTNNSYGWSNKLFRVMKVSEISTGDGTLAASIDLNEYNASVYDDVSITQYSATPNSNLADPSFFGTIPAPTVTATYPTAAVPLITVQPYVGTASFVNFAEIWYSAFASPSASQIYLLDVTQVPSNGVPISPGGTLPSLNVSLPAGDWYLFSRLVNVVATSQYSPASALVQWRPTTFQYTERYINVRYASSFTGTGFSTSPRGLTYYGLQNTPTTTGSTNPADYTWYLAPTAFGSSAPLKYLLFANRSNRKFSFSVGTAAQANNTGAFVPTLTSVYDPTIWNGLPDGTNSIDLDARTGQLTSTGTTSVSSADGLLSVTNNTEGNMVVSLAQFLNFGAGVYSKTAAVSTLTIDIYGRVVGFTSPDGFYYTETVFTATASQTTFSVTHTVGNVLVFKNGLLLDLSEYTETSTTVVLGTACAAGEIVVIINARAVSTSDYYENNNITIASSTTNTVIYSGLPWQTIEAGNLLCFSNTGTPTTYTVSSVNTSTKVITFTGTISGATAGLTIYRYRAASSTYRPWSRYTTTLAAASTYTPTEWAINNGYEQIYVNGCQFNEIDYDVTSGAFTGFPAAVTGNFTVIQWNQNNLAVPCSNVVSTVAYSVAGVTTYTYASNPLSMEIYANGVLLAKGVGYDYTATSTNWILATAFPDSSTLINQQTFARDGAA